MTAPAERPPVAPWSVQLGTCWAIVHARTPDDAKLKLLVRLGMTYIGQTEIDDEWMGRLWHQAEGRRLSNGMVVASVHQRGIRRWVGADPTGHWDSHVVDADINGMVEVLVENEETGL
jgi:hypothetical protein